MQIKEILESKGLYPSVVCRSGAEVLRNALKFDSGIVICAFNLTDMTAEELRNYLSPEIFVLVVAQQSKLDLCTSENIFGISSPVLKSDLISTVKMLLSLSTPIVRKNLRTEEDNMTIKKAKLILMGRNSMTEKQAHRFIQKTSMDHGVRMTEIARLIMEAL